MATLFISDLHLQASCPEITERFCQFLQNQAATAEALYILGDLFEAWVGDDNDTPLIQQVVAALRQLTEHGVALYFIVGNRDFLMGKRFSKACGGQLLADPSVITLYGNRVLISHGDLLCTGDSSYLRFRRIVRLRWLQKLFLLLPLKLRQRIAVNARQRSQYHVSQTPLALMDVTPGEDEKWLQQYQAQLLIHGHTHRPAIHTLSSQQTRIVLPAWDQQGGYLLCQADDNQQLAYQLEIFATKDSGTNG
ncbi:MAG: UDP-2,3-diacylglucosamine diphosphatase [Gammaproteobacteria bacterium]|nr:UDP-2,3-diacylglucosamine diphosphatase [Gammaproteobacteria bacterium]